MTRFSLHLPKGRRLQIRIEADQAQIIDCSDWESCPECRCVVCNQRHKVDLILLGRRFCHYNELVLNFFWGGVGLHSSLPATLKSETRSRP